MLQDRQPTKLGNLGKVLTVSRPGRSTWLPLTMITLVVSCLCGRLVGRPDHAVFAGLQEPAENPVTRQEDEKAVKAFLEAYHLEPGQILKLVPPPRPQGMRVWMKTKRPGMEADLPQIAAMTLRWRDPDQLQVWASRFGGGGWPLRDLLRYLETNIYEVEIDGDRKLLDTVVTGDWVYRQGVDDERKVHALEATIQRVLRLRISLTFRKVERDVIVVRGEYRHSPLTGRARNEIDIYGKQIVPDGGGSGGGSGPFPEFLKWVGEWIERPVVSDIQSPPKEKISWFYNGRSPFTEEMRREDHDEALVLQHLHEQTGLTFTRERRPIRILFIERAK